MTSNPSNTIIGSGDDNHTPTLTPIFPQLLATERRSLLMDLLTRLKRHTFTTYDETTGEPDDHIRWDAVVNVIITLSKEADPHATDPPSPHHSE